ncbi:MAG: RDD family protein [Solirubrobacterales bacterium]|nr:RDD family protein [Solirubrobacterales bacterium]
MSTDPPPRPRVSEPVNGTSDIARRAAREALRLPFRLIGAAAERVTAQLVEQKVIDRVAAEVIDGGVPQRVLDQVLASRVPEDVIDRLLAEEVATRVVQRALAAPGVEPAAAEVIDSKLLDELTDRVLASPELQRTVEQIANSDEVRSALTRQSFGLIEDIGGQIALLARRLDGVVERPFRWLFRRGPRVAQPPEPGAVSRVLSLAVDAVIVNTLLFLGSAALALVIDFLGGSAAEPPQFVLLAGTLIWSMSASLYLITLWTLAGQTPGMRFLRIRIQRLDGSRLRLRDSIRRLFGLVLAALPFFLGFLGILTNDRRRGWQDRIGRTEMLYVEPDPAVVGLLPRGD